MWSAVSIRDVMNKAGMGCKKYYIRHEPICFCFVFCLVFRSSLAKRLYHDEANRKAKAKKYFSCINTDSTQLPNKACKWKCLHILCTLILTRVFDSVEL